MGKRLGMFAQQMTQHNPHTIYKYLQSCLNKLHMSKNEAKRYLIIGKGRLAKNLSTYFNHLRLNHTVWHRKNGVDELEKKADDSSHVLILIPDQAIDDFISTHKCLSQKICVHCSGSLTSQYAYTAHPLQSFTHTPLSLSEYESISFILESEGPSFEYLLPGLKNPHYFIPKQSKMYYHSLCVMANNFTTLLWQKFFSSLEADFQIPKQAGMPFLKQTCKQLLTDYKSALTGPLTRKDQHTLLKQMAILKQKKDPYSKVFQSFLETDCSFVSDNQ